MITHIFDVVDSMHDAFPEDTETALPLIAKLLVGKPLSEENWSEQKRAEGYVWRPVLPRTVQPGDVVRVKPDAYPEPPQSHHNGLQGRVSALRNGVYVIYDGSDTSVPQMGVRHLPDALERRVMVLP